MLRFNAVAHDDDNILRLDLSSSALSDIVLLIQNFLFLCSLIFLPPGRTAAPCSPCSLTRPAARFPARQLYRARDCLSRCVNSRPSNDWTAYHQQISAAPPALTRSGFPGTLPMLIIAANPRCASGIVASTIRCPGSAPCAYAPCSVTCTPSSCAFRPSNGGAYIYMALTCQYMATSL